MTLDMLKSVVIVTSARLIVDKVHITSVCLNLKTIK